MPLSPSPEMKSRKPYSVIVCVQKWHQICPNYESSHEWSFLSSRIHLLSYYLTLLFWHFLYLLILHSYLPTFLCCFVCLKYLLHVWKMHSFLSIIFWEHFLLSIYNYLQGSNCIVSWNICDKNSCTVLHDFSSQFGAILLCSEGYCVIKEDTDIFWSSLKRSASSLSDVIF